MIVFQSKLAGPRRKLQQAILMLDDQHISLEEEVAKKSPH